MAGPDDVDLAVAKAREAFDQGHWSRPHPSEREDILIGRCKLITPRTRELAVMKSLDSGNPIRDCDEINIPRGDPHDQMARRGGGQDL